MKMRGSFLMEKVKSFWNHNICGTKFINKPFGTKDFFEEYSEFRYRTEWHLNELVPFDKYKGKKVIEIGCGIGSDAKRFAENGAIYTGIDLTDAAVKTCKIHFSLYNLSGEFLKGNAESLSFLDNSFDLVYSHGVLHHTENIRASVREIHRVLKPNGEIIIMLYHKNSFNYYLRIMIGMRLAVLLYILVRPILPKRLRNRLLEQHYNNYLRMGRHYFHPKEFLNHCTDGVNCPIARAYTKAEVKNLFYQFSNLRVKIAHFPLKKYVKIIPLWIERFLARKFGWYMFIYGRKKPVS